MILPVFYGEATTVCLADFSGNCESKAGAAIASTAATICLAKAFKDVVLLFRGIRIGDHCLVFGYFADRYGLEQVGAIYPVSPSSEPSAQDIAALEDAIREDGVPAVFIKSTVNPGLAEQVARDTGTKNLGCSQ